MSYEKGGSVSLNARKYGSSSGRVSCCSVVGSVVAFPATLLVESERSVIPHCEEEEEGLWRGEGRVDDRNR